MKKIGTDEVKKIQLDILDVVVDFCNKNNLRYFLAYGTLIGAVRHKGYIPWDDDIDIVMLRPDYDKLVEEFNKSSELYKVYSIKNTKWFPFSYAKVAYEKSLKIEHAADRKNPIGINIDIFPVDGVPDNENVRKKHLKKLQRLQYLLHLKSVRLSSDRPFYKNLILLMVRILTVFSSRQRMAEKINRLASMYKCDECSRVGNLSFSSTDITKMTVPVTVFEDVTFMEFEGKMYAVPAGYHQWLTTCFGDYMQLPPEEQRVSTHRYEAYLL